MGRDIHVRIVKKDRETNTWKHVKLYHKEKRKFKVIDVYPFRNYELFDILDEKDENDEHFFAPPIVTDNLPIALKNEIETAKQSFGFYGFREINLADLKLYLNKVPKIRDYDYEDDDPKAWKDNPVKYFIEKIEQYIEFAVPYWDFYSIDSDIRIIYWFDC